MSKTFAIQITWLERGTRNAACVGNDETITIESDNPAAACRQAAEDSLDHHDRDWGTGKYDLMAEHVGGTAIHSIQYCDDAIEA